LWHHNLQTRREKTAAGGNDDEEDEVSAFKQLCQLCPKLFNGGFLLASLNIIVNSATWAFVEPLLKVHYEKYLTLNDYSMAALLISPSIIYVVWCLLFFVLMKRYNLMGGGNLFNIMGYACLMSGIGFILMGPIPLYAFEKDSVVIWITQIVSMILINLAVGIGYIPSIPAMKLSVKDDSDFFDDLLGSLDSTFLEVGVAGGPMLGVYLTSLINFECTTTYFGIFLIFYAVVLLAHHCCYKSLYILPGEELEEPGSGYRSMDDNDESSKTIRRYNTLDMKDDDGV
jgi:MFS family permease